MEKLPVPPSTKGPEAMFTGDVYFDVIYRGEGQSRMRANTVRFAPCARTAWHSHAVGQTLYVTEGTGLVQSRGGGVIEMLGRARHRRGVPSRSMRSRFPDAQADRVEEIVDEAHHFYDGRPDREFIPVLVGREAREVLELEHQPRARV